MNRYTIPAVHPKDHHKCHTFHHSSSVWKDPRNIIHDRYNPEVCWNHTYVLEINKYSYIDNQPYKDEARVRVIRYMYLHMEPLEGGSIRRPWLFTCRNFREIIINIPETITRQFCSFALAISPCKNKYSISLGRKLPLVTLHRIHSVIKRCPTVIPIRLVGAFEIWHLFRHSLAWLCISRYKFTRVEMD